MRREDLPFYGKFQVNVYCRPVAWHGEQLKQLDDLPAKLADTRNGSTPTFPP